MIKLGIVMGGYSNEYVISLQSGMLIYNEFSNKKYTKYAIHILKEGWYAVVNNNKLPIDKSDFSFLLNEQKIKLDVVYNIIHGTPGEDGHLQAYFELINMPYSGARFYQSALSFNKRDTLSVLDKFNIKKAQSIYTSKNKSITYKEVVKQLGVPFFIKPNQSGSSLGISRVTKEEAFKPALEVAFKEDKEILIESELKGREVSVGVLQLNNQEIAIGITEIIPKNDFFDYEAKYHGKSTEITPAELPEKVSLLCKKTAENIYKILNMNGFARVDFILVDNIPYFIEINTNPGMSPESIYPQQIAHSKYNFSDLLDNEINLALKHQPIWNE